MFSEQLDSDSKFWTKSLTSTIGLGALWRFPYLLYTNNGATFLLPFIIIMIFLGIPQYFLELSLGQYFQESMLYIYQKPGKKYGGVTFSIFLLCLLIGCYYIYVVAFALLYIFHLVGGTLPWNSDDEITLETIGVYNNFFKENILRFSEEPGERFNFNFPLLGSYALVSLLVYFMIRRELITNSKAILIKVAIPFVFLLLILAKLFTQKGFLYGFFKLTIPHTINFIHPGSWVAAAEQVLFQLSLGAGTLINLGAIRRKKSSVLKPCFILPMLNTVGSCLSGIVIYGFLGFLSNKFNSDIENFDLKSEGLIFTVYPMIFHDVFYGKFFLGLFLVVFIISGIDSQVKLEFNY